MNKVTRMNKNLMVVLIVGLLLVGTSYYFYDNYPIPKLIPQDYNCEEHPGIISDSNPFLFESSQHYINRKNVAVQKQIEEVCK